MSYCYSKFMVVCLCWRSHETDLTQQHTYWLLCSRHQSGFFKVPMKCHFISYFFMVLFVKLLLKKCKRIYKIHFTSKSNYFYWKSVFYLMVTTWCTKRHTYKLKPTEPWEIFERSCSSKEFKLYFSPIDLVYPSHYIHNLKEVLQQFSNAI